MIIQSTFLQCFEFIGNKKKLSGQKRKQQGKVLGLGDARNLKIYPKIILLSILQHLSIGNVALALLAPIQYSLV